MDNKVFSRKFDQHNKRLYKVALDKALSKNQNILETVLGEAGTVKP